MRRMPEIPRSTVLLDLATTGTVAGTLIQEYMAGMPAGDDFLFYTLLAVFGEPSPTLLAHHTGMPLTTVSDRLNRIAERGHAERIPNPEDGRSFLFRLTDSGWSAFRDAQPRFLQMLEGVQERLDMPVDEVRAALRSLEKALRGQLAELNEKKTPAP
jgi:MarR family transcriptional regulator, lower aerobic nicotinate degradation pathway regulator